jgi:hypothetical protein
MFKCTLCEEPVRVHVYRNYTKGYSVEYICDNPECRRHERLVQFKETEEEAIKEMEDILNNV